jgi:hypothetical protein
MLPVMADTIIVFRWLLIAATVVLIGIALTRTPKGTNNGFKGWAVLMALAILAIGGYAELKLERQLEYSQNLLRGLNY